MHETQRDALLFGCKVQSPPNRPSLDFDMADKSMENAERAARWRERYDTAELFRRDGAVLLARCEKTIIEMADEINRLNLELNELKSLDPKPESREPNFVAITLDDIIAALVNRHK